MYDTNCITQEARGKDSLTTIMQRQAITVQLIGRRWQTQRQYETRVRFLPKRGNYLFSRTFYQSTSICLMDIVDHRCKDCVVLFISENIWRIWVHVAIQEISLVSRDLLIIFERSLDPFVNNNPASVGMHLMKVPRSDTNRYNTINQSSDVEKLIVISIKKLQSSSVLIV